MPEGPEVRRVVDKLQKYKNKTINEINFLNGRYKNKGPFKNYNQLEKDLPLKIKEINCKGKFIYFILENDMILFNTLGMSGFWTNKIIKHNNVSFLIDNKLIYFNDYRNFGTFMYQNQSQLKKKLDCLGPDILFDYNKFDLFDKRLERKRKDTLIGSALLDQKVACGCGNYLRAEVLYQSKINPFRKIENISKKERNTIWNNLTKIGWIFYNYEKGIKLNILQKNEYLVKLYILNDYYDTSYYFNFMVYMRDKDDFGNKVYKQKINTRMIHYVPKIQK